MVGCISIVEETELIDSRRIGAPEAYQVRHQAVTEKLDIWSLGCIFSEVCVWISRGHKGLTDFRKMRKEAGSSIPGFQGGNCFHNGFRMQEQVSEYLIDLKAKLQERDDVGGMVLDRMVFEMLEEEPTMRPSTYQLRGDSLELIRVAKDKLGQTSWPQKSLQKQTALDSRDDQLSNTSHLEPEEIATTVKVSPGVAYCSLEEAERWYNRRKSGDTNAELPDHNLLLELKDRKHVYPLLHTVCGLDQTLMHCRYSSWMIRGLWPSTGHRSLNSPNCSLT